MNEGRVSVCYAKALLAAAKAEPEIGKTYYNEVSLLLEVLANIGSEFHKMLQNTQVAENDKWSFVERMVSKVAPSLNSFVQLMYRHQRIEYFERALRVFQTLYSEEFGIVRARVEVASTLSDASQKRLSDFLKKTFDAKLEIDFAIEHNLIGGFTVEVNDRFLDCSLAGELRSMLSEL